MPQTIQAYLLSRGESQPERATSQSALSQGADLAVQSTHKVLGSMGQSSMLHTQGTLVDRPRISRALQTLQVSCLLLFISPEKVCRA